MLTALRSLARRAREWFPLAQAPATMFAPPGLPGAVSTGGEALTVSAFWCGVRLYMSTLGSLPLVTYRKAADGGRERADDLDAYHLLHERPNPAQSRAVFFAEAARAMLIDGQFLATVRKTEAGDLVGLYPVPAAQLVDVVLDAEWNKWFWVREAGGDQLYADDEVIHTFLFSADGIRGESVLRYAGDSLGLHRQVIKTAAGFYKNAVRPAGYLKYPNKLNKEAVEVIKQWFKEEYAGAENVGKLPVTHDGGEFVKFPNPTADDAKIIEALSASVDDVARWLNVSPLLLFNLARGTYSNLSADNQAFYQRTIRPVLEVVELELNRKAFGVRSPVYAEFNVDAMLRGDPLTQAQVANTGIQNGSVLRSEQRAWLNLPPIPGLDEPLTPANMLPAGPTPDTPTDQGTPNAPTEDGPPGA